MEQYFHVNKNEKKNNNKRLQAESNLYPLAYAFCHTNHLADRDNDALLCFNYIIALSVTV